MTILVINLYLLDFNCKWREWKVCARPFIMCFFLQYFHFHVLKSTWKKIPRNKQTYRLTYSDEWTFGFGSIFIYEWNLPTNQTNTTQIHDRDSWRLRNISIKFIWCNHFHCVPICLPIHINWWCWMEETQKKKKHKEKWKRDMTEFVEAFMVWGPWVIWFHQNPLNKWKFLLKSSNQFILKSEESN